MSRRNSIPLVRAAKRARGADPLVMLTAYDEPSARIASAGGVDIILVGDSVADNVLGYESTIAVTIDDLVHHTAAVARARPDALIVGDLPWMSYHVSVPETLVNAARLIRAGAQAVKLEGGHVRTPMVEALIDAEIPVMGHLGLTPQSVVKMGGYRVQANSDLAAKALLEDALALEAAGCFAIVLEGIPDVVAEMTTATLSIPTIGIGAGPSCDGQVLVFHDLLGLNDRHRAKFVRTYVELGQLATTAIAAYVADVRSGEFPSDAETYHASAELSDHLKGVD